MLDLVFGQTKHQQIAENLLDALANENLTGTLYIGYPVLATADDKVEVDALLVTKERGLVAFSFASQIPSKNDGQAWTTLSAREDLLYFALNNNLSRHDTLRSGRKLAVDVSTVTLFPTEPTPPDSFQGHVVGIEKLSQYLSSLKPLSDEVYRPLEAALQRVTTIKPAKKRESVTKRNSRGGILQKIEREISNLDQWQKRAAIESPEGPQRIRGLAGSGKTVVLALKAAYLHAQHPDWKIAVTYYSRSLYQQFRDLIRRFSFEHLGDEPNWENLRVVHSWGSSDRDGVYSLIAESVDAPFRDYMYARSKYGMQGAFEGVCGELLAAIGTGPLPEQFHAVLIDEAQDLPPQFFQLIYKATHPPKRIIWAYDELQKLSEGAMPSTAQMFGVNAEGTPLVNLSNAPGRPRQDIVLPVCYRNTPWALSLAHGLGFGTARKTGLIQHFDEPGVWEEIGYQVVSGNLDFGEKVSLQRAPSSYPDYFPALVSAADAVTCHVFDSEVEQAEWVASEIVRDITTDELEHDDILIVLPDAYTTRRRAPRIQLALSRHGIGSHLVGVTSSRDEMFVRDSVAIAHIYRSKGNEAPMVYALDCQDCFGGHELIRLRNILFTAVTRSRAWVRLCGYGSNMQGLYEEFEAIRSQSFQLRFTIPTHEQLRKMRMIHRERTADERARIRKAEKGLSEFLDALRRGDVALENLPLELRVTLARIMEEQRKRDD